MHMMYIIILESPSQNAVSLAFAAFSLKLCCGQMIWMDLFPERREEGEVLQHSEKYHQCV